MQTFIVGPSDIDSYIASRILTRRFPGAIYIPPNSLSNLYGITNSQIFFLTETIPEPDIKLFSETNRVALVKKEQVKISSEVSNITYIFAPNYTTISSEIWDRFFPSFAVPGILEVLLEYKTWTDQNSPYGVRYYMQLLEGDTSIENTSFIDALLSNHSGAVGRLEEELDEIHNYIHTVFSVLSEELIYSTTIDNHLCICANALELGPSFFDYANKQLYGRKAAILYQQYSSSKFHNIMYSGDPSLDAYWILRSKNAIGGSKVASWYSTTNEITGRYREISVEDYTKMVDPFLLTDVVNRFIHKMFHGHPGKAFYGTYRGLKTVFYNSPIITPWDFFSKIDTRGVDLKVQYCKRADGLYRIITSSTNALDDSFGYPFGQYRINICPSLDGSF